MFNLKQWSFLVIAILLSGCPGKPRSSELQIDRLRPLVFSFNGIPIVYFDSGREPLELRLVIHRDSSSQNPQNSSVEALALASALQGAAKNESFANRIEASTLQFDQQIFENCSVLQMACLSEHLDSAWSLWSNCLLSHQLDPNTYLQQKDDLERQAESRKNQPDLEIAKLVAADGLHYPFAQQQSGEGFLENLGLDQVNSVFQSKIKDRSRLSLVVTGTVDLEQLGDLIFRSLGDLTTSGYERKARQVPKKYSGKVVNLKQEDGGQTIALYIPDLIGTAKSRASLELYGAVLEEHLRLLFRKDALTLRQLRLGSYGGSSAGIWLRLEGQRLLPKAELIMSEIRTLAQSEIGLGELSRNRQLCINRRLGAFQSNRQLADLLVVRVANHDLEQLLPELRALQEVQAKDIERVVHEALGRLSWYYCGKSTRIDRKNLTRIE